MSWSVTFSNYGAECIAPSLPILESAWACKAAMHRLGQNAETYEGTEDESDWPSGCYYVEDYDGSWLNEQVTSSLRDNSQSYCHEVRETSNWTSL
jgi:hypothetical protein